ncbi:MAG: hypothetical protein ACREIC_07090 [Limisphaerales bacterium]
MKKRSQSRRLRVRVFGHYATPPLPVDYSALVVISAMLALVFLTESASAALGGL